MHKFYFVLRNFHLLLNALILPIAAITISSFNKNLGGLEFWYAFLGMYFFFLIWAMMNVMVESGCYPENLPGALLHTGGLILSLILFVTFFKTGWKYAVYVSFYNSFVAVIIGLICIYVSYLRRCKSLPMPPLPWWGHGIVFVLMVLSLAFTCQTGIPFFNELMQTAWKARAILIVSFLGQAANTVFHWRGLNPHPSKKQTFLIEAQSGMVAIVTILSVFAAFVILSGALNNLFNQ
jgi:hypothetical protein